MAHSTLNFPTASITSSLVAQLRLKLLKYRTDHELEQALGIKLSLLPRHWSEQANLMLEEKYLFDAPSINESVALDLKLRFFRECMHEFESTHEASH